MMNLHTHDVCINVTTAHYTKNNQMKTKKTKAEIDKDIKFIPMPEWQNTYQYHRTNKRALYVDQNKKR